MLPALPVLLSSCLFLPLYSAAVCLRCMRRVLRKGTGATLRAAFLRIVEVAVLHLIPSLYLNSLLFTVVVRLRTTAVYGERSFRGDETVGDWCYGCGRVEPSDSDHHCDLAGVCVTRSNRRWFLMLLMAATSCGLYALVLVTWASYRCGACRWIPCRASRACDPTNLRIAMLIAWLLVIQMGLMFVWHLMVAASGCSTREVLKDSPFCSLRSLIRPYHLCKVLDASDICRNLLQLLAGRRGILVEDVESAGSETTGFENATWAAVWIQVRKELLWPWGRRFRTRVKAYQLISEAS